MARVLNDPTAVAFLDPARRSALLALAEIQSRPPIDLLNEAVDALVDADRWHRAEIEAGLREADAGDFASAEEVEAAFAPR